MWMARWKPTASSGYQATIDSVISGNNGLMKTGEGTLVLAVSYTHLTLPTKRIV